MRGGAWGPVMSLGSCLVPLSAKYRTGGGGEMNGGGQEGTGGFGQAGKQCLLSIIYSWVPRRRASSWQRAARCGWPDSCPSELPLPSQVLRPSLGPPSALPPRCPQAPPGPVHAGARLRGLTASPSLLSDRLLGLLTEPPARRWESSGSPKRPSPRSDPRLQPQVHRPSRKLLV